MTQKQIKLARVAAVLLLQLGVWSFGGAAQAANEVAKYNAWTVYKGTDSSGTVCFSVSAPVKGRSEGDFFYVSAWPKHGVRAEPSVRSAAAFRKGSSVTVSIGPQNFILFTANNIAYVEDPTRELQLLDAMKKGSTMFVSGVNNNGARFRDTYSLAGVTASIGAITKNCG